MSKITPRDNPCYCINFRRAANTLTKFYDKAFEPMNLTTNQFSLLIDINLLKSCNKSELALYTRLDRTTIIRSLKTLNEKGLIEEIPGLNNRNKVVQLTATGKEAIKDGYEIWKSVQKQIKAAIGEENIPILQAIFANTEALNKL